MLSKVRGVVVGGLLGACSDDFVIDRPIEPAVIVDAFPGGTVIYQGDDLVWRQVPPFGERFGFDVTDRYGVALVDRDRRLVDALFTTVATQSHVSWPAPPVEVPRYQLTGMATSTGVLPGRAAGKLETVGLFPDEPYLMIVPEGSNTLAFGRINEDNGRIDSLILHRDLPIVADLTLDVDFTTAGLPSTSAQVRVANGAGCEQRSVFTFRDTSILLDARANVLTFPHVSQWLATDHLTFEVDCGDSKDRATLVQTITREHLVPTEIEGPIGMSSDAEFSLVDERFHFGWSPYYVPVEEYELTVSCAGCARWTAHVTEPWLAQFSFLDLDVFSPPDLAALGLLEPGLELPDAFDWSITARIVDEQRRVEAVFGDRFTR